MTVNINNLKSNHKIAVKESKFGRSILGCVLSIILMPTGFVMDYFMHYDVCWKFLEARLACSLLTIIILLLHYTKFGKKYLRMLTFAWLILLQITICWMIFVTDGYRSSYYAGLNAVILGAAVVVTFDIIEMLVFGAITLALYLLVSTYDRSLDQWAILLGNLYFIIVTLAISCAASLYTAQLRFREFCLKRELEENNKKLLTLDQMKSDFFANISHEFRTPLTLILVPTQDIINQQPMGMTDELKKIFNIIHQNGLRLLKLVNDVLDVIRLDECKTLNLTKIELNKFLNQLIDSIGHLANMQKIKLIRNLAHQPLFIDGDLEALEKVIFNILTNAVKFTKKGGTITVVSGVKNNQVFVEIADSGIGIAESELPYIFDRFRKVDNASTKQYRGSGLGLALVKELMQLHRGEVVVKSQLGVGTSFILTFPISQKRNIDEKMTHYQQLSNVAENKIANLHKLATQTGVLSCELEKSAVGSVVKSEVSNSQATVLVIDDEVDMRSYIVDILQQDNYRVIVAEDGEMGLNMIKQYKPDLVILDLMLPKIDGLEICKIIRSDENYNDVKVMLLTARADELTKINALKIGADDFLTKPFNSLEIKIRARNLIKVVDMQKRFLSLKNG